MKLIVLASILCSCHVEPSASGALEPDASIQQSQGLDSGEPDVMCTQKIIAIMGQSNARGQGNVALVPAVQAAYPAVRFKQRNATSASNPVPWVEISTGDLKARNETPQNFGTELSMGRDLDAAYPGMVSITKLAVDSSSLNQHWRPASSFPNGETPLHQQAIDWMDLSEAQLGGTIVAFVWIQGETDALTQGPAEAYQANMVSWLALLRTKRPGMAFVFNRLHSSNPGTYASTVRSQQEAFALTLTNGAMVDSDGLPLKGDFQHFTPDGYVTLGQRIATAIVALNP